MSSHIPQSAESWALPHVVAIPPYPPGRPIEAVAREFGLDPAGIVKLASNENPLGCAPAAAHAIARAAATAQLYPDFDSFELREAIGRHVSLPSDHVLPGAGSSELIVMAARAFLDAAHSAVIPQYSFQAYAGAVKSVASNVVVTPAQQWGIDLEAVLARVNSATRIVFVATVNNPTGAVIGGADLARFVDALPHHVLLIVDEAYREYQPPQERLDTRDLLARRAQMLILRTFSKIHGLAGLRVGYALGEPALLQVLRRLQLPFSVNSIAQQAAVAALGDKEFPERSRVLNERERARVGRELDGHGIEYLPSGGNFLLARVGDGPAVTRELMRRGVIVRPMDSYGLREWIRATVGRPEENARFLGSLLEVRRSRPAIS
jgi:histidinol-phosphate aminotransferase